jgi:CelD/BcsL family acetyltransferase involved in cellulose biosynthesis
MNSRQVQESTGMPTSAKPRGAGTLRVEAITDLQTLERHAEAWDNLAFQSVQKTPMISYAWVASHLEFQLDPGMKWVCLCAFDGNELKGVLPVLLRPTRVLGLKRTEFCPPCSQHTRSVEPAVAEDRSQEIIRALFEALSQVAADWHGVGFTRIPESSPLVKYLSAGNSGIRVIRDFNGNGAYLNLTGTYGEYIQSLSKNFSRNLRRLTSKIELLSDFEILFFSGDRLRDEHLDWFAEVEASGWKGDQGTAILRSPQLMAFYQTLTRRMASRGWLEWHFVRAEGKVIAANMAARMGRTLVLLKIAYRDEYSSYAPGNVLLNRLIERLYESGDTNVIDCMTEMSWNRNWNMKTTAYFDFQAYNPSPITILGAYLPRKTKDFARSLTPIYSIYRRVKGVISRNKL